MHFKNCQLTLSMTATFDVFKIPDYVKIIIIVFNIETYLKYLLFDKLHELMDSNIYDHSKLFVNQHKSYLFENNSNIFLNFHNKQIQGSLKFQINLQVLF